jgi:hypothetical protein
MWILLNHGSMTDEKDPSKFINLSDVCPYITLLLSLATNLEVALQNTKYQHQDSGITNTHIVWNLLNHGSTTDERYSYTFHTLFGHVDRKLHYSEVWPPT